MFLFLKLSFDILIYRAKLAIIKIMIQDARYMIHEKGQVMLITILTLSGILLGATTIAGLLMTYQIRQATDITNSTKAIMAADAGIEWELYKISQERGDYQISFSNGAALITTCKRLDSSDCLYDGSDMESGLTIRSIGQSLKVYRAFEMTLQESL